MWAENKAYESNLKWETDNNFLSIITTNRRKASATGARGSVCNDRHKNEYLKWKHMIFYDKNY
jgi:hypothetical protein